MLNAAIFRAAVRHGYWYCERENRVVQLPHDLDTPARCPHCKHPTAVWMPPCVDERPQRTPFLPAVEASPRASHPASADPQDASPVPALLRGTTPAGSSL